MLLCELKIDEYFVVATAKGRSNAQTFRVKGLPYHSIYEGCTITMIPVQNMRKGTTGSKPADIEVVVVKSWINPFPKNK